MNRLALVNRAMEREAGRVYIQAGTGFHCLSSLAFVSILAGLFATVLQVMNELRFQDDTIFCFVDPRERWGQPFEALCVSILPTLLGICGSSYLRAWREKLVLEMKLVRLEVLIALSRS